MSNVSPVEVPRIAPRPPDLVPWWTAAAPSRALRRGGILRFDFGGEPVVVFRGRNDGVVRAIPAHCQHQGVDLSRGHVSGDCLRCPLHHWEYSDRCEKIPGLPQVPERQRYVSFVAAERYGMIFIHPAADHVPQLPDLGDDLHFIAGSPIELDCPWWVPIANAFDMAHLRTVHHREPLSEPATSYIDRMTMTVRYSTAVTGTSWSDRAMRALSNNRIDVSITTAGTMVIVDATAGRLRSFLMASCRPASGGGVSILPLVGVPRRASGLHHLHAPVARLLFRAFLHRDFEPLRGIRFPDRYSDLQDPTIDACYRHLCQLPAYRKEERR